MMKIIALILSAASGYFAAVCFDDGQILIGAPLAWMSMMLGIAFHTLESPKDENRP